MKKFTYCVLLMIISLKIQAQLTNGNFTTEVDYRLQNIDKVDITSNILIDRVYPASGIQIFNQGVRIDTSSYLHFKQAWSELNRASYIQNFITIEQLKQQLKNKNYASNMVPIGIINTEFHEGNYGTTSENSTVDFNETTGLFANKQGRNPFVKKQTTIIAPLVTKVTGASVTFTTDNLFTLYKQGKQIKTLVLNTNGSSFALISNYTLTALNFTTSYTNSGTKNLQFVITYSDNTSKTTYGKLSVIVPSNYVQKPNASDLKIIAADSDLWFQGYEESQAYQGQNEYRIYYDKINNDATINKPLYIIDGFDPEDARKIDELDYASDDPDKLKNIVNLMKYKNNNDVDISLINSLNLKGYDVIIVNHPVYKSKGKDIDGGSDYIERNAYTFISLIRYIKSIQQGNEEAVVIGPSMGGLISRYALAYMEQQYAATGLEKWNHNTRLWVSFDSPHQGANIPIGVQKGIQYFADKFDVESAKDFITKQLGQPATKQMLINHYTNNTNLPVGAPNFRNRFQTALDQLGMPQNLRKIALLNGSILGALNGVSKAKYLKVEDNLSTIIIDPFFGLTLPLTLIANIFADKLQANFYHSNNDKTGNSESFTFDGGIRGTFLFWSWWTTTRTSYTSQVKYKGSYDVSPGGYFNAQQQLANESTTPDPTLFVLFNLFHSLSSTVYDPTHSFIPTKSALAYTGSTVLDEVIGYKNRVCSGDTPFDSYFAPEDNQEHIFLNSENVAWLTQEIEGNEQGASTYIPNTITIAGNSIICYGQTAIFSTSIGLSCVDNITWSTSKNIQITGNNGAGISVQSTYENSVGNGWITATLNNGASATKNVKVGKPEASRIALESFKSYPIYTNRWTNITARYNGLIDVGQLGYTWEWIVPSHAIKHASATYSYLHVKPIVMTPSVYIKTRARNECGCSDWKGKWFTVKAAPRNCIGCPTGGGEIHY